MCRIPISSGLAISSPHCPSSPGADISPCPPAGAVPPLGWAGCLHFCTGECGKSLGRAGSKPGWEWHSQLTALTARACPRTGDPNLICWVGSRGWSSPVFLCPLALWSLMSTVVGGSNPAQTFPYLFVIRSAHTCVQNLLLPSASTTSCGSCSLQHAQ